MTVSTLGGVSYVLPVDDIKVNYLGGGSVLTPGPASTYFIAPYDGLILGWYLVANTVGNLQLDIWKSTTVPNSGDTIVGSDPPKLTGQQVNQNENLTQWITKVTKGDIFGTSITSVSGIENAVLSLRMVKI